MNSLRNLISAVATIAFIVILPALASADSSGGWAKDPVSGIEVWLPQYAGTEIVSWSGGSTDGKASGFGVLSWFDDCELAGRFEGTMEAGKVQGRGNLFFVIDSGYSEYQGEFENSELNGFGILKLADGGRIEGQFEHSKVNGHTKYTAPNGASYTGDVKDNTPHGTGRQVTADGEEYYGDFVDGVRHGDGTLLLANGGIYTGPFVDGLPNGNGTLTLANGGVYEGPFVDGLPDGEGKYTTPDGDVAHGRVIKGVPDGKIVFTLKDGGTREEIWKDGKKVQ